MLEITKRGPEEGLLGVIIIVMILNGTLTLNM